MSFRGPLRVLHSARRLHVSHSNRTRHRAARLDHTAPYLRRDPREVLLDRTLTEHKIHSTLLNQARHSIIIENKSEHSDATENMEELKSFLSKIGNIECIEPLENTVNRYIVQFRDTDSVRYLLDRGEDGEIESHMVTLHSLGGDGEMKNSEAGKEVKPAVKRKNGKSKVEKSQIERQELRNEMDALETMEEQFDVLMRRCLISSTEIRVRYLFLYILERILRNHLDPSYELYPYGSSLTGGGVKGSDMDVAVLTTRYKDFVYSPQKRHHRILDEEWKMKAEMREEGIKTLQRIGKIVEHHLPSACGVQLILNAKVPILTCTCSNVDLSLDLCVNEMQGIGFSNVINWYIRYDARVLPVMLAIRKWAESRNLLSHGMGFRGFTPFMLQVLTLIFLMRVDVVPPMMEIGRTHRDAIKIYQTPAKFSREAGKNNQNAEELVCEFFRFYSFYSLEGMRAFFFRGIITRSNHLHQFSLKNPFNQQLNIAQNCDRSYVQKMAEEMRKTKRLLEFRQKKLTDRDWGLNALLFDGR